MTVAVMHLSCREQELESVAEWISLEVLPHERDARRWLQRSRIRIDIDDVIQEAYARIAALDGVGHIRSGRAYLLATIRSIALQHLHRSKIVPFESYADLDPRQFSDDQPDPEAIVWSRREVARLLRALPERSREIFVMCRIKGHTQKETAAALGISENVVEKQIGRAMDLLVARFGRDSDAETM